MKTLKVSKVVLDNVAYDYCFIEPEEWIALQSDVLLKFDNSASSFVVRRAGDVFVVEVRPYRRRDWSLLFHNKSARSVLQSLYDFLYS